MHLSKNEGSTLFASVSSDFIVEEDIVRSVCAWECGSVGVRAQCVCLCVRGSGCVRMGVCAHGCVRAWCVRA